MPGGLGFAYDEMHFRAFGSQSDDLEIDFGIRSRPLLEVQILACCGRDAQGRSLDPAIWWQLEIGRRIEALLSILARSGIEALVVAVRCGDSACREPLETELTIDEVLASSRRDNGDPLTLEIDRERFLLRRPTGADQQRWLEASYSDPEAAMRVMAETLLAPEQRERFRDVSRRTSWIPAVERALDAADPLPNASVTVRCPVCQTLTRHSLDLGGIAIAQLRELQRQLLSTIQRLALRYHWSEAECFQVPPWRRSLYLRLLDQEGS